LELKGGERAAVDADDADERRRDRGVARRDGDVEASSIHWFPYDRVGVVNADP
jgi:hypothetical protein